MPLVNFYVNLYLFTFMWKYNLKKSISYAVL